MTLDTCVLILRGPVSQQDPGLSLLKLFPMPIQAMDAFTSKMQYLKEAVT